MSFPQASDYRPPIIPDGEIYDNPENDKSYYWTQILLPEGSTLDTATSIGGYWTVVCEAEDPRFVLKAGDTMTGALELAKPLEDTQDGDGFIIRGTTALNYEDTTGDAEDGKLFSVYHNSGAADAINYLGKINSKNNIVNKGYVDEKDNIIRQDIFELEEEIDAIAPSVERGQFVSTTDSNAPRDDEFMLATLAGKTLSFGNPDIVTIQLSKVDNEGAFHTYADVKEGQLIQLFEDTNSDYGLYLIESIAGHDDSSMTAVTFTVSFVSGFGQATEGDLARLKIFSPPEGGDPDGFVLKTGDEMTGNLTIDKSEGSTDIVASLALKGSRPSTTNSAATIAFENDQSTNLGYLTYRSYSSDSWFGFNRDIDLGNNKLHNVAEIRMQSGGYIGISTAKRLILRSGGSNDANNAATEIQRPGDNKRTFAIKGKAAGSSSTTDFFWAYGNSGSGGDAINYTGLTTQDNHIATKKYVDSKASSAPTYTITKSGGNYYVS